MKVKEVLLIVMGILIGLGCSWVGNGLSLADKQSHKTKTPLDILKEETENADVHFEAVSQILSDYQSLVKEITEILKQENIDKYSDGSRLWAAYLLGELRVSDADSIKTLLTATAPFWGDPDGYWFWNEGTIHWIRNGIRMKYYSNNSFMEKIALAPPKEHLLKIYQPPVPVFFTIEDDNNKIIRKALKMLKDTVGGKEQALKLLDQLINNKKIYTSLLQYDQFNRNSWDLEKLQKRLRKFKEIVEKWEEKKEEADDKEDKPTKNK